MRGLRGWRSQKLQNDVLFRIAYNLNKIRPEKRKHLLCGGTRKKVSFRYNYIYYILFIIIIIIILFSIKRNFIQAVFFCDVFQK